MALTASQRAAAVKRGLLHNKVPPATAPKPPTVATPPINSASIRKAATAIVQQADAPTLASLSTQAANVQAQGAAQASRASGYYTGAQQQLAQTLAAQQGFDPTAGIRAAGQDAIANLQSANNKALADEGANEATRGAGLDGGTKAMLAAQLADNTSRVNNTQQTASDFANTLHDSNVALLANQLANNSLRSSQAQGQVANQTGAAVNAINQQKAGILAQEPGNIEKEESDLSTQAFNNYATLAGLNLKGDQLANQLAIANLQAGVTQRGQDVSAITSTSNAATTAATAAAALKQKQQQDKDANTLKQAQINASLHIAGIEHHAQLLKIIATDKAKGRPTAAAEAKLHANNEKIRQGIVTGFQDIMPAMLRYNPTGKDGGFQFHVGGKTDGAPNWAAIRASLANKYKDADIVNAIINLYENKRTTGTATLSAGIAAKLKARHIGIPANWG